MARVRCKDCEHAEYAADKGHYCSKWPQHNMDKRIDPHEIHGCSWHSLVAALEGKADG